MDLGDTGTTRSAGTTGLVNEYIQYLYSVKISFTIIFVFGKLPGYEYIQYSYSVKFSFTNMFVFIFAFTLTAANLVITVES